MLWETSIREVKLKSFGHLPELLFVLRNEASRLVASAEETVGIVKALVAADSEQPTGAAAPARRRTVYEEMIGRDVDGENRE